MANRQWLVVVLSSYLVSVDYNCCNYKLQSINWCKVKILPIYTNNDITNYINKIQKRRGLYICDNECSYWF